MKPIKRSELDQQTLETVERVAEVQNGRINWAKQSLENHFIARAHYMVTLKTIVNKYGAEDRGVNLHGVMNHQRNEKGLFNFAGEVQSTSQFPQEMAERICRENQEKHPHPDGCKIEFIAVSVFEMANSILDNEEPLVIID